MCRSSLPGNFGRGFDSRHLHSGFVSLSLGYARTGQTKNILEIISNLCTKPERGEIPSHRGM